MKKTLRTVLTAAAFAAANMCAMPTAANAVNEQPKEINPIEEAERKLMPLYGPPPSMLTTTNTATVTTLITSTTTTTVCVYGPMTTVSVTSDYLEDLTTMTTTTFPPTVYDLNKDGEISVGDLVRLNRFLHGTLKDFDDLPDKN